MSGAGLEIRVGDVFDVVVRIPGSRAKRRTCVVAAVVPAGTKLSVDEAMAYYVGTAATNKSAASLDALADSFARNITTWLRPHDCVRYVLSHDTGGFVVPEIAVREGRVIMYARRNDGQTG